MKESSYVEEMSHILQNINMDANIQRKPPKDKYGYQHKICDILLAIFSGTMDKAF